MAIICAIAEGEHERRLTKTGNLYVLEPIFRKALDAGGFQWIQWIDPYGDTVLNALQIPDFLEEWSRLFEYATSEAERQALQSVREIAAYCLEEPHRYLRFYGD